MSVEAAQAATKPVERAGNAHVGPILFTLILGAFVAILNQTLLNVALPQLMNDFSVSANTVQWLTTAYMMTNGILIPITAFLIGTFTTRQLFIGAMAAFTVGSLVCSVAPSFPVILLGRVIQALGAGVIMPLLMTVVLNLFPPESRGKAMGMIGIAMIFAPAVGPTLSGWVIETWTWRVLFWIVIPIAVIDIILAVFLLRNATERTYPRFDGLGFITSTIGFGALLYGFSEAGNNGWSDARVVGSIVIGVIAIILFIWRELTAREPMLKLQVFRYDMFSLTTIVSCVVNMAMFAAMILVPIYIQNIRGFTPFKSGLLLMPGALLMGIMSPIAGTLFDRIGARPLVVFGLIITMITTWDFSRLTMQTSYAHIMWLYTARMFGMSFIMMTIMTAGLNQLPRQLNAHGTAAANTARTVAGSLGTAIMVTLMTTRSHVHMGQYANSVTITNPTVQQFIQHVGATLGVTGDKAQTLAAELLYGMASKQSTVDGINDSFLVATLIVALALVLSLFIRRVQPPKEQQQAETTALVPQTKQAAELPQPAPVD
ncbi:MAG: DHA2 family efflux MFS transporter permease subunit [Alicyclobacillus herbarius]|uniref:DHA2 family efflux MFS transporter permease subunit n=1 Tax=Alicyclobacillus herbarius TaxID=122960 RepID=UPI002354F076|nr:DHA2 family efflux MFS transporter permease subunit [Alicyclobacillus herbarius]MCL6632104.1 DHA2 family efflux MFS transporter permease subunit [Alicyclobacillus herbarius]